MVVIAEVVEAIAQIAGNKTATGPKGDRQDVQLHYFQHQVKNRQAVTEVISPRIDRNGRIDQWPDSFFDEWRKSLAALI